TAAARERRPSLRRSRTHPARSAHRPPALQATRHLFMVRRSLDRVGGGREEGVRRGRWSFPWSVEGRVYSPRATLAGPDRHAGRRVRRGRRRVVVGTPAGALAARAGPADERPGRAVPPLGPPRRGPPGGLDDRG